MKKTFRSITCLFLTVLLLFGLGVNAFASSPVPYSGMSSQYKNSVYYQRLMAVPLGENQIENLINVAASQIGYTEGSKSDELAGVNSTGAMKNYTEYGKRLGKSGYAWCCAFVSWCIYMAGIPGDVMPNRHAGCSNFIQSLVYNYGGTFHSADSDYKPQAGDIIFYEGTERTYDANGIPKISGHVGIVYEDYNPSTKKFGVIEGNGPGYVQANYQPLFRKGYTEGKNYILGYVTPAYTSGTESQQGLVVRLTTPTQTTYVNKQFITETNACVVTQIYKTAGSNISKSGLILMYADGSLLKRHTDDITGVVGKNTTVFHSWYDINKEVGVTLSPGTTYKYRFFAVVDGITFEGDTYSFTTKGSRTSFNVYFNANGGSVSPASKTVYSGNVFGVLPDPVRDGYDFQGWYTAASGGNIVSANTNVNLSGDITLYAQWKKAAQDEDLTEASVDIISVTDPEYAAKHYVSETAACLIAEIHKTPGFAITEAGIKLTDAQGNIVKQGRNTFTDGKYTDSAAFYLWYDTKDHLGITLSPGTTYKYSFYAIVDGKTYEGPVNTFTTSAPSSFTATLYSGLDYSESSTISVTKGQAYGYLPGPTVPQGYKFLGWFTAKEGGERVLETGIFNGSSDISLYARYEKKPLEVIITHATDESYAAKQYVSESSACLVAAVSKTAGSEVSEVGMYFMDADGKLLKRGIMDAKGQISKESTIFHVWCDTEYNLDLELQPGTTYRYRFFALVDGQSFEGPEYSFTTKSPSTFTATFYSGLDYSSYSRVTLTKGHSYGALPTPYIPENYEFLGWFTAKEGGEQVFDTTIFNGSSNIELYARYARADQGFTISYSPNGGEGSMPSESYEFGEAVKVCKNAFSNTGYSFEGWVLYRKADDTYYTNEGWANYETANSKGYVFSVFPENSSWLIDEFWTEGCEDAREFSFVAVWDEKVTEPVSNPFTDVKPTDYFYEPVLWAVDKGVTSGLTPASFGPKSTCTRAQVVTFLWRAMGKPAPSSYNNPFTDVKSGDYFYEAVLWAVEQGITNGLSATSFGASQPCTRAQVATFLWRTMGKPAPSDGYCPFGDVAANAYYYNAVLWAVENGVTSGLSSSAFGPNAECSRAQIVTFLYRAIEK